MTTVGH